MSNRYELSSLRDVFEKVPAERIRACMAEIAEAMVQARAIQELMAEAARALDPCSLTGLRWPDTSTWTDDDKGVTTIGFVDGDVSLGEVQYVRSPKA